MVEEVREGECEQPWKKRRRGRGEQRLNREWMEEEEGYVITCLPSINCKLKKNDRGKIDIH